MRSRLDRLSPMRATSSMTLGGRVLYEEAGKHACGAGLGRYGQTAGGVDAAVVSAHRKIQWGERPTGEEASWSSETGFRNEGDPGRGAPVKNDLSEA
jgi:hypothetical protein